LVLADPLAGLVLGWIAADLGPVSRAQPGDRSSRERDGGGTVTLSRRSLTEIGDLIRQSEQRVLRAIAGPVSPPPVNPVAPVPKPMPGPLTPPPVNPVAPVPPGGIPIDNDSPAPGVPTGPTP
jgi:hypothetical protein